MLTAKEKEHILYAASHLISGMDNPEDAHAGDSIDLAWDTFDDMLATRRDIVRDFGGPLVENDRGEWVPAIPIPEVKGFLQRPTCSRCGTKFWAMKEYEAHFALDHIVRGW